MIDVVNSLQSADESTRRSHLEHLSHGQESYLESLAKNAQALDIKIDGLRFGYALVRDATVLEFCIEQSNVSLANSALAAVVKFANANSILCQSFDTVLMSAAKSLDWLDKPVAHLFRKFDTQKQLAISLEPQSASEAEMPRILSIHDGFFDDDDEIRSYISDRSRLFIYQRDGVDVACGIIKQTVSCRNDYDIGMVVAPEYRGRGYGAEVLSHLKSYCLDLGWYPIAGCSMDNPASKRSLERAGFIAEYQLVRYARGA
ncbi:MAG: GNAT family N-acetyltransferase [Candidatus Obscuribacter sp.]|nr:GNAT family N-acetyltransferase [Candidatus Obscuribacter sp.]MBP6347938.1 GNAT family N-acetyltransferase [Candidatus Obscuribacter sp.]MBP6591391.1 GNAT family N-acetyltransferase [Candidatus Obscuribacter sp.]MBP7576501.1 GNAT family N-acetyltransferase [Candidatus Obscuribacter sp.]